MGKSKINKGLIVLCTILIIIIIGLVGYIGYTLGSKTTTLPLENKTEETENTETEINDYKIIKEISIDIDNILGSYQTEGFILSQTYATYRFRNGILKNSITQNDKQLIALETVEWDNITGTAWQNYEKMNNIVIQMAGNDPEQQLQYIAESKQISEDKLNEQSIKLFGEKIENPVEEIGSCPIVYYDSNSKTYFRPSPACGGASASYVKSYKSKFTQKKDEVYAYVSFAYLDLGDNEQFYIYKDIETGDKLSSINAFKERYTLEDPIYREDFFTVNENNYQHFSEYKFIFKKDTNDNYYFVSVEQTK